MKSERNPHGLGYIVDDNPRCILTLTVRPVRVKHQAEQRTEIIVTAAGKDEVSDYE